MKSEKLREKFFLSWTKSVAELARKGGLNQKELEWDSYDKVKEKIIQQQLHCTVVKANAKRLAKIRAEKAALVKAEKTAKLAQKRREQEEKAKAREEAKRKASVIKRNRVRELTLKKRLTKVTDRIANINPIVFIKSLDHSSFVVHNMYLLN